MSKNEDFLAGGGEMGERIREFDWAATPLGPPAGWPPSLKVTVRVILNTGHPMFIWWGPDLIQFYNDAYKATMGPERHPSALGARGRECWDEIWHIIGRQIEYVMAGNGSTWDEDKLVPVTRHGKREDVWWTYSYGPIDREGGVGGVLVVCSDVTQQHLARERLKFQSERLRHLFQNAPGLIAILRGSDHRFEIANDAFRAFVGNRECIGLTVRKALPEIVEQGFIDRLDGVLQSGEPLVGTRVPVTLHSDNGRARDHYVDFIYAPLVEHDGSISGIFVEGHDVTAHVEHQNHLQLMNNELKHRVKNTLAMVSAIASQTLKGTDAESSLRIFRDRLATFGAAHDILTASESPTASLRKIVESALSPHDSDRNQIRVSGPDLKLGSKQALSLSLAINELATNATKYGALKNRAGSVRVEWDTASSNGDDETLRLRWSENGGPAVAQPSSVGFGTKLITRVLNADFGGSTEIDYRPEGVVVELVAPVANLLASEPS